MADAGMNIKGFTGALSTMYKEGAKTAKSIEQRFQKIGGKMQSIGGKMTAGLTLPLAGAGAMALKTAADYEKLRMSMNALNGSAEEGGKQFERLKKFSAQTPFQLQELAKAQNMLQGFGMAADDAFESMSMIGDIAAISGGNINEIGMAFGQAAAEGRLMSRDIKQLINQQVPATKLLAETMGVAKSEIFDLASQGKISFEILQQALQEATSEGGMFANGMKMQANTLAGKWSTFTDNFSLMMGQIGQDMAEAFNIKGIMDAVTTGIQALTEWFSSLSSTTKTVIFSITGLVAAAGPLIAGVGTLMTMMPILTAGVSGLATAFAVLTGPVGIAVGAIAALTTAGAYLYDNWDAVKDSMNRIWISMKNTIVDFVADSIDVLGEFFSYLPGMGNLFKGATAFIKSFKSEMPAEEDAVQFKGFTESIGNTLSAIMGTFDSAAENAEANAKRIVNAEQKARQAAGGSGGSGGERSQTFVPRAGVKPKEKVRALDSDLNSLKLTTQGLGSTADIALGKFDKQLGITSTKMHATLPMIKSIANQFTNSFGQGLSNIIVKGKGVVDVLKNIGKLLASSVIQKGLSVLLSGGLAGGGFFGSGGGLLGGLFKGVFHGGGIVPGGSSKNVPILAQGGEGVFTKGQMRAMGNMRSGGSSVSPAAMQKAFENAIQNKMNRLGPNEMFAIVQKGKMGY